MPWGPSLIFFVNCGDSLLTDLPGSCFSFVFSSPQLALSVPSVTASPLLLFHSIENKARNLYPGILTPSRSGPKLSSKLNFFLLPHTIYQAKPGLIAKLWIHADSLHIIARSGRPFAKVHLCFQSALMVSCFSCFHHIFFIS